MSRKYTGIEKRSDGKFCARYSTKYLGCYDNVLDAVMARENYMRNLPTENNRGRRIKLEGFTERLNQAINKSGMDVSVIGRKTGISRGMLYKYQYEMAMPTVGSLAKLSMVLNVSSDWLLGIEKRN